MSLTCTSVAPIKRVVSQSEMRSRLVFAAMMAFAESEKSVANGRDPFDAGNLHPMAILVLCGEALAGRRCSDGCRWA